MIGELIMTSDNYSLGKAINPGNLPNGIYFIKARLASGLIATLRIVKD